MSRNQLFRLLVISGMLLLLACGQPKPTVTPSPTTAPTAPPSETATPTSTLEPTATPTFSPTATVAPLTAAEILALSREQIKKLETLHVEVNGKLVVAGMTFPLEL